MHWKESYWPHLEHQSCLEDGKAASDVSVHTSRTLSVRCGTKRVTLDLRCLSLHLLANSLRTTSLYIDTRKCWRQESKLLGLLQQPFDLRGLQSLVTSLRNNSFWGESTNPSYSLLILRTNSKCCSFSVNVRWEAGFLEHLWNDEIYLREFSKTKNFKVRDNYDKLFFCNIIPHIPQLFTDREAHFDMHSCSFFLLLSPPPSSFFLKASCCGINLLLSDLEELVFYSFIFIKLGTEFLTLFPHERVYSSLSFVLSEP